MAVGKGREGWRWGSDGAETENGDRRRKEGERRSQVPTSTIQEVTLGHESPDICIYEGQVEGTGDMTDERTGIIIY